MTRLLTGPERKWIETWNRKQDRLLAKSLHLTTPGIASDENAEEFEQLRLELRTHKDALHGWYATIKSPDMIDDIEEFLAWSAAQEEDDR